MNYELKSIVSPPFIPLVNLRLRERERTSIKWEVIVRIFRFVLLLGFCLWIVNFSLASAAERQTHVIEANGTRIRSVEGSVADLPPSGQPNEYRGDYVWRSTHEGIIGSSVGISRWEGRFDVMVGHENYPPTPVEIFDAGGTGVPYWSDAGQYSQVTTRAGVYALADYNDPSGIQIVCWDADLTDPVWTYDLAGCLPAGYSNTLEIDMDGNRVCFGCFSAGQVRLVVIDAITGTALVDTPIVLDGPSLRNISVTDNGQFVDLNCGAWHVVYDVDANAERARVNVGASTNPCGISETGEWIVAGFTTTKAYQWDPDQNSYVLRWNVAGSSHYAGAMMVTEQGYFIVGWYNGSYNKNRLQRFELDDGSNTWTRDLPVSPGDAQDLPSAIDYSRARDLIAFGFWGDTHPISPEILVIDPDGRTEYSCHAPGSMFDVAISENGSYVAATGKLVHANQMGSGSDAYCGQVLELAAVDQDDMDRLSTFADSPMIASPNPFQGTTRLMAELPSGVANNANQLCIFDIDGRVVNTLAGSVEGNTVMADWDGNDDSGLPMPAGVYYGKIMNRGAKESAVVGTVRLILLR
jgi:hypothetical protein